MQVALAVVLLVSAGLMIRSFVALRSVEPGFVEPDRIQTLRISIPDGRVAEPGRVWAVDANLPLARVQTLGETYAQSMSRTSFTLVMLAIAGIMALALGLVGIYGVISYAVTEQRREIGIRLALGAARTAILRRFLGQGFALPLPRV